MRRILLLFAGSLTALVTSGLGPEVSSPPAAIAADADIEVTSALDTGGSGGAVCPHDTLCTLRRAIEIANADAEPGARVIRFDADVFPPETPVAITIGTTALPTVTRPDLHIDASGAGVELAGTPGSLTATINGLTVSATGFRLSGLHIHGFTGSCIAILGSGATVGGTDEGAGNMVGGCETGIAVSGTEATIQGNVIGFTIGGAADPVETGIVIAAANGLVGGPAIPEGAGNRIGFANVAVFTGSGETGGFSGTRIERNVIGKRPDGEPAAVTTGVLLSHPSSGATVAANEFSNAAAGIVVHPDGGGASIVRNRLSANTFETIAGLAIDLGGDGLRDVNDAGDADGGPNTLLNHPVISRATQTRLTGTACPGCQVQVYRAQHAPGGLKDYGSTPLPNGTVSADGAGVFAVENPAAAPGDWLVALATDPDGNTSEFGPPARVGAGAVLCGNVQLLRGWNHVGYFGSEPVALFGSFTPAGETVTAIYRALDGTDEYERWFSSTTIGRTLHTVLPGESYWFFAEEPVTLAGGFQLSFPLPVQLEAGWNDFPYLGATAAVADALGSLGGDFEDLYRFDSGTNRWLRFGDTSIPSWAQAFTTLDACGTYQLRLDEPATLIPLQP